MIGLHLLDRIVLLLTLYAEVLVQEGAMESSHEAV